MLRKVRVPYLWDAFNKKKEADSEHSKRLHSSETVYLIMYIRLFLSILSFRLFSSFTLYSDVVSHFPSFI